jgi:conjugal transfer mating pair stabilization protein TraN
MEEEKLLFKASFHSTRLIATLTASIFYAMYLFQPYVWADSFTDRAAEGRAYGTTSVEAFKPGDLNATLQNRGVTGGVNATVPQYDEAQSQKGDYTGHYTNPAGMTSGADNTAKQFVVESESTRAKIDLSGDATFGYKCEEKDAAGKCTRWSSSSDVLSNSYPDCQTITIPTYNPPPEYKTCTGQHTTYDRHCNIKQYATLTQETITQQCSSYDPGIVPGQIYARCEDVFKWYKVADGRVSAVDDCYCGNHGVLGCFSNPQYLAQAPPAGATFYAAAYEMISCDEHSGWDTGTSNKFNWYYAYDHSRVERLTITEDSTCPDFDEVLDNGKCVVKKMVQCNGAGTYCVTSIDNGAATGDAVPSGDDAAVKMPISNGTASCFDYCSYAPTESGSTLLSCTLGEVCLSGACTATSIVGSVPAYYTQIGTSRLVSDTGNECDPGSPAATYLLTAVDFAHYQNTFSCATVPGELDNYKVCMRYDSVTVDDSRSAGVPLGKDPVRDDWTTPYIVTAGGNTYNPYNIQNSSLRGGPDVKPYRNVWQMGADLTCKNDDNDCQALIDAGCSYYSSECSSDDCVQRVFTYKCGGDGRVTSYTTTSACAGQMRCMGTECTETIPVPAGNFAAAAAAGEILNNMKIDTVGGQIFPGQVMFCQDSPKNCCDDSVGGVSIVDYIMFTESAAKLFTEVGEETGNALYQQVTDMVWQFQDALGMSSTSIVGDTINTVMTSVGDAVQGAITATLTDMGVECAVDIVGTVIAAVGTVLWVVMILYIIYEILSFLYKIMFACDTDDMMTSVKLTLKLCHLVGVTKDNVLGMPLKRKAVYCCFNSILARLIQEQGRPQVGKGWGTADSPDCSGFSPGEMMQIDTSTMDLSEYMQYVQTKSSMTMEEQAAALQNAANKVNGAVSP